MEAEGMELRNHGKFRERGGRCTSRGKNMRSVLEIAERPNAQNTDSAEKRGAHSQEAPSVII